MFAAGPVTTSVTVQVAEPVPIPITGLRGGAWTPAELGASLALWLDADDASTITLDGSNVPQWDDKSGNDRHVSQATASAQPEYGTRTLNSKNVLDFDGADFLTSASHAFTTTGDMTVMIVSQSDGAVVNRFESMISMDGDGDDWQFGATDISVPDFYGQIVTLGLGSDVASNTGPHNGPSIYNLNFDQTGSGIYNFFVDGSRACADETYTTPMNSSLAARIMTNRPGTISLNGLMAEVVVTNTVVSLADRQKLEGYLAWKWGLEANLPSDHPYKSTPPTV